MLLLLTPTWTVKLGHDTDSPESRVFNNFLDVFLRVHVRVWIVRALQPKKENDDGDFHSGIDFAAIPPFGLAWERLCSHKETTGRRRCASETR